MVDRFGMLIAILTVIENSKNKNSMKMKKFLRHFIVSKTTHYNFLECFLAQKSSHLQLSNLCK
jgi:hypothetical protein